MLIQLIMSENTTKGRWTDCDLAAFRLPNDALFHDLPMTTQAVLSLCLASVRHDGMVPDFLEPYQVAHIARAIQTPTMRTKVFEDGNVDEVLGIMSYEDKLRYRELKAIAVAANARRRGIGRSGLQLVATGAQNLGLNEIRVQSTRNPDTLRFYGMYGFRLAYKGSSHDFLVGNVEDVVEATGVTA